MKRILLLVAMGIASSSIAQLSNTVPTSGPVGIGTASPASGKQLTVNGNAIMLGSLEVDNTLTIDGQAILNDVVRMPSLTAFGGALDGFEIIVINEYGQILRSDVRTLVAGLMYASPALPDLCVDADSLTPHWFNGLHKIFIPCPDVNVGIGTSTPDFKLDVIGETYTVKLLAGNAGGTMPAILNAYVRNHDEPIVRLGKKVGALAEEVRFEIDNDGAVSITNVSDQPSITINNGTGHAIVIKDNSGNKIAQLQNDGLLRSRSLRVDLGTWADHVLGKDYKLLTLKEIKHFIQQNGHLPDVPNAQEIAKEGLDIGEIQRIQMQKIEELTLHLIEMDERMAAMQNQMGNLQTENNALKAQIK